MKLLFSLALISFVALPTTSRVFAWDETGHKISAYIAWQRMAPAVRDRVVQILLKAPEDSTIPAFYTTYVSQDKAYVDREFFLLMSTWADMVRDRNQPVRYRKYNKSNWHYSDTFWSLVGGQIKVLPPPDDAGLALERLQEFSKTIAGNASDSDKAIAIAWLQHIIGDIHQPLHTSARVTDLEPKGDQGGNLFLLTPQGTVREEQRNLHSYWDNVIGDAEPNTQNRCDPDYINPLAEKIMKKHSYAKMQPRLAPGAYAKWVSDSLALAQKEVFSPDLVRFQMPSKSYRKKAVRIAEEQIALAGYRMADLFNGALSVRP